MLSLEIELAVEASGDKDDERARTENTLVVLERMRIAEIIASSRATYL
jgi:hypothetical protein